MSLRVTLAVTLRVLGQLRRDRRTVALMIVVPSLLVTLLWWVFIDSELVFDRFGATLLGVFPFIVMFIVTSIATLRERTTGTLERLFTMPLAKLDLLLGYALAFALVAVVQALVVSALALWVLGLDIAGSAWVLVLVAVVDALLGTALGLLASAFASTEFQAVQFMPAFVLPQILLCGLFIQREDMPGVLQAVSDVLPLSYAVDATTGVAQGAELIGDVGVDVLVVVGFVLVALVLGAATLRRQTP